MIAATCAEGGGAEGPSLEKEHGFRNRLTTAAALDERPPFVPLCFWRLGLIEDLPSLRFQ